MQLKTASALERELSKITKLQASIWYSDEDGTLRNVNIVFNKQKDNSESVHVFEVDIIGTRGEVKCCATNSCPKDLIDALKQLAKKNVHGPSMKLKACHLSGAPGYYDVATDDLLHWTVNSTWQELLGTTIQKVDPSEFRIDILNKGMRNLLSQGGDKVEMFNRTINNMYNLIGYGVHLDFNKTNADNANLENFSLVGDFKQSSFNKAKLKSANLGGDFTDSKFKEADLSNARLQGTFRNCDFTSVNLSSSELVYAELRRSCLKDADFTDANLRASNLREVDLSVCKSLKGAKFAGAMYDEKTVLPDDFLQQSELVWKGLGPDPYTEKLRKLISEITSADFDEFIKQINKRFDEARIKKALDMLKKEEFQLFTDVDTNRVGGIVKSQTDKELVYSCRLASDGNFSCCTQNLKPCGGLKGSLCKHLLVLVIGLVKTGKLDPTSGVKWVLYSTLEKPNVDKDLSSELFLKYKGAEKGEIDWRPTHTVPEDYYAY